MKSTHMYLCPDLKTRKERKQSKIKFLLGFEFVLIVQLTVVYCCDTGSDFTVRLFYYSQTT